MPRKPPKKKDVDQQLRKSDGHRLAADGFQRAKFSKDACSTSDDIEITRAESWSWDWLVHGFSTRQGGVSTVFGRHDLNLSGTRDSPAFIRENRVLFLRALETNARLTTIQQIHSARIHILHDAPEQELSGDGLISNVPGLLLAVSIADCVPVLVVDPLRRAVGAFHAGWRGTAKRIVEKGIGMMRMAFGCDPAGLHAAIGPCIRQCCYAIGQEVVDEFRSQFDYANQLFQEVYDDDPVKKKYPMLFLSARPPGHSNLGPQLHLDLLEANRHQLRDAGLRSENIWTADLCTSCNPDRFFSHRAENGFTGRMMGVIGVKDSSARRWRSSRR